MAYAKRRVTNDGRVRYTAVYLDPTGRDRSAGTFDSKRVAERAARGAKNAMVEGKWIDPTDGKITFRRYVEEQWWPSRHLELHSKAAYRFHDLRHAHASWALAGGADLKAVMDRLGHAQITTTQRYLHTLPESDDQALIAFSRIRNRTGNPQTRRAG